MDKKEGDRRVFFTNEEWDRLALYLIGNNTRYRENVIIPRIIGPVKIKTREEKMVEAAFESCAFKTLMSCVAGELVINQSDPYSDYETPSFTPLLICA
jgi:import inner membrane translocase subunit TIM22